MTIEQLKLEKKRKKMTLQQIADISGVPKRTVDDVFSGHTKNPRIDTIQAIEKALRVGTDLWTAEDYANGVTETRQIRITPAQDDLLALFDEMDEQQQQLFFEMGKAILKTNK